MEDQGVEVELMHGIRGRGVLVTGASGFVGGVLAERVLRLCAPRTLYLLLRPKRGRAPAARLQDLLASPVWERVRREQPALLGRVVVVEGDLLQEGLGLSAEHYQALLDDCDLLFHCAACVRFDMALGDAVAMNVAGTERVLTLAKQMRNLKVLVHVSTAYCQCDTGVLKLEERVYPAPHPPRAIISLASWMNPGLLNQLTPGLMRPQPNTYAYTKCLGEELVASYQGQGRFSIVIARPSIVAAAWREPAPGWVSNLNGPTGLLVGAGKGVIRSMLCEERYHADVVPVDIVANACLVLAARALRDRDRPREMGQGGEVVVCNICASDVNPLTWGQALRYGREHVKQFPFSEMLWYPGGGIQRWRVVHLLHHLLLHLLPAYLLDAILILLHRKPFMVRVQQRVSAGLRLLQYYTVKEWRFCNATLQALPELLSPREREVFYTDLRAVNWDEYIRDYILGARRYCCKEDPSTLPSARALHTRLFWVDVCVRAALAGALIYALLTCVGRLL